MIGVEEDQPVIDAGRGEHGRFEHRPPALAIAELRVIEARAHREADERERRGEGGPPLRRARARGERDDGDRREDVLDREHVGEEARAAARVVAVEIKGRVGRDLRDHREREEARARASGSNGDDRADHHEQRERLGVERIDEVLLEPPEGGADGFEGAIAAGEVRGDEVAVLAEAADPRAKSIAKAARRAVSDRVVRALRGEARQAGGGALVGEEEQEPGEHAERREANEANEAAARAAIERRCGREEHEAERRRDRERADRPRGGEPANREASDHGERGGAAVAPLVDGVNGSKSQGERGRGAEGGEPVRHGVGRVVAERGADHREEGGDLRDAEEGLRRGGGSLCEAAGDAVGEVPGGDGDPRREERAYREGDPQKKAQREQERVARGEDHRGVGAFGSGGADEEAAHRRGLGGGEGPRERAVSQGARFEPVARGVDDPRAAAEVPVDVHGREGRRREGGDRDEDAASGRGAHEPRSQRHRRDGEDEGDPLGEIARGTVRRHRRRLLLRGAADNGASARRRRAE